MHTIHPIDQPQAIRLVAAACLLAVLITGAPASGDPDNGSRADAATNSQEDMAEGEVNRYLVIRTFPAGALDGLDDSAKEQINATNADNGVRWVRSYANADLTRTYCVYEAPSEEAIMEAAEANGIPVDEIVEVPVDLSPRRSL